MPCPRGRRLNSPGPLRREAAGRRALIREKREGVITGLCAGLTSPRSKLEIGETANRQMMMFSLGEDSNSPREGVMTDLRMTRGVTGLQMGLKRRVIRIIVFDFGPGGPRRSCI